MDRFTLTLTGTHPLVMHNATLSDPLHASTKALAKVTGKRKKTEDDHLEIARLEFMGGLYFHAELGPYVPGENVARCLVDGARLTRRGMQLQRGVFITSDVNPVVYRGPRTIPELWAAEAFRLRASVKVQQSRTIRTRPLFPQWEVTVEGTLDPSILDPEALVDIATTSGQVVGLGDFRPRYGRFNAAVAFA